MRVTFVSLAVVKLGISIPRSYKLFFSRTFFFKDLFNIRMLYYLYKKYLKYKRCFLRSSQQISSIAIVLNYSLISPSNLFNKNVITNEENIGH